MSQTKTQLVEGLNINTSAPATALQIDASGNINLDSNTLYVDATNNRVGLGTSSPSKKLHVVVDTNDPTTGSPSSGSFIQAEGNTTTVGNGPSFALANASGAKETYWRISAVTASGNNGDLVFNGYNGGANYPERLRITASGNVGIGTTTVGAKLHIVGGNAGNCLIDNNGSQYTQLLLQRNGTANTGGDLLVDSSPGEAQLALRSLVGPLCFHTSNPAGSNAERARIDSSGRLLVGTSSARTNIKRYAQSIAPSQQIVSATETWNQGLGLINYSASGYAPTLTLGLSASNTLGTNTLVSSGHRCGVITFNGNDGTDFEEAARIEAFVDGTPGADDMPGRLVFSTTADGASSPTERMRISANGTVSVSASQFNLSAVTGHASLYVEAQNAASQNAYLYLSCPGSNAGGMYYERSTSRLYAWSQNIGTTGVYIASGGTSWTSVSDERLKDIIEPIENATEKVASLRAVIGKYKTDDDNTRRSFLIAQDVQAVLPEAVSTDDPDALGVAYTDVIPLLVAAIKELKQDLDAANARLDAAGL